MSRKVEITFEVEKRTVIKSRRGRNGRIFCAFCQKETEMLSADEAALTVGASSLAIFRGCQTGQLHFIETSEGLLLICGNSLEGKKGEEVCRDEFF